VLFDTFKAADFHNLDQDQCHYLKRLQVTSTSPSHTTYTLYNFNTTIFNTMREHTYNHQTHTQQN